MGMKFKVKVQFVKVFFTNGSFSFRIELLQYLSVPAQDSVDFDNLFFTNPLSLIIKTVSALGIAKFLVNSSYYFLTAFQAN